MPPHINFLALSGTQGSLVTTMAPSCSSNSSMESATPGSIKDKIDLTNNLSLTPSTTATYLTYVVDNVTQCCVRLVALTMAPPSITARQKSNPVSRVTRVVFVSKNDQRQTTAPLIRDAQILHGVGVGEDLLRGLYEWQVTTRAALSTSGLVTTVSHITSPTAYYLKGR